MLFWFRLGDILGEIVDGVPFLRWACMLFVLAWIIWVPFQCVMGW